MDQIAIGDLIVLWRACLVWGYKRSVLVVFAVTYLPMTGGLVIILQSQSLIAH